MNIVITILAMVSALITQVAADPLITPEARQQTLLVSTTALTFAANYMTAHPEIFTETAATIIATSTAVNTPQIVVPITTTIQPTQPSVGAPAVAPKAAPTCTLTPSISTVTWNPDYAGTYFTLTWTSTDATQGRITTDVNDTISDQIERTHHASVEPNGSAGAATNSWGRRTDTYKLYVSGEGGTAVCTASVITK